MNLKQLRQACEGASQDWKVREVKIDCTKYVPQAGVVTHLMLNGVTNSLTVNNAKFLNQFNPAFVGKLLDIVEAARAFDNVETLGDEFLQAQEQLSITLNALGLKDL